MSSKAEPQTRTPISTHPRETKLDAAIENARSFLMSSQTDEGYWIAELEADTTLESDYITYLHIIGKFNRARVAKLARYVRQRQLADGGWNIYFGGPSEVNATVKAYLALRLAGDAPADEHMMRACKRVRDLGGLERTNSFTRLYLALLGLIGWEMVPAVPPELMFLPSWSPINVYEMSSWTRAIVIPLTILYARKPCWPLPGEIRVDELFADPSQKTLAFKLGPGVSWRNCFLTLDRALKVYDRLPWKPGREWAVRKASHWTLEHLERSDGLAAIYPAMMNSIYALMALGHAPDNAVTSRQIAELARFEIEDGQTIRLQPCLPPVWDTAIAAYTLIEADMSPNHPDLEKTASWLLDRQITGAGDWQIKNRDAEPGGWAFEFRNDFYPDVDDTAFVLMALERMPTADPRRAQAIQRGLTWMVSMQNSDGGWAAFDRDNNRTFLNNIPFADHNAMLDPSSPDLTARVLECLGQFGWNASHPRVRKAIQYLIKEQTPEGAWYGRWGVNYVYGASGVLRALAAVGATTGRAMAQGITWLRSVQHDDGGFGESCATYDNPNLIGQGESTPSQTAWGLLGLLTAAPPDDPAVTAAVAYLLERQNDDGSWDEAPFTGTGFPKVFYLKYHLYRHYFPLYALARYRRLAEHRYRPRRQS